jgi:hypothetical protein
MATAATTARHPDPYRNLIEAVEQNIRLVLIEGKPRYGLTSLMRAAGAEQPEPIPQAGRSRSLSLTGSPTPLTWKGILQALEGVRADPAAAMDQPVRLAADPEEAPFQLIPDMPEGTPAFNLAPEDIRIPPLDTLHHDRAFLNALQPDNAPILNGLLNNLHTYYH